MAGRDDWFTTADSNTDVDGINIAELCDPGNLNNAMRAMMALLANQPEVAVASAGTTNILGAASRIVRITGTTNISSLGTGTNRFRFVRFTGALTLNHNSTSLILPGGANIVTASGDTMIVVSDASSNARVIAYQKGAAAPLTHTSDTFTPAVTFVTAGTLSVSYATQTARYYRVGSLVYVYIVLTFTPTLGTASGAFRITGLPLSARNNNASLVPSLMNQRWAYPTGITSVVAVTTAGATYLELQGLGDGQNSTTFTQARLTDGTQHTIVISGVYETDA